MSHMSVRTTKILQNCDSWFNKNYNAKTNTSHDEKIKKFSEDSEYNFERGENSELVKDTDRSNFWLLRLNLQA